MEHWPTGRLLSTAARLVEHSWNEKLGAIGLTHAGVIAIEVLAAQGPMTQAQLAQFVRVQAQTMGKTLSRLESHGHIVRVRSTSDRRSHVVSLTERGKEAVAAASRWSVPSLPPRRSTLKYYGRSSRPWSGNSPASSAPCPATPRPSWRIHPRQFLPPAGPDKRGVTAVSAEAAVTPFLWAL
jgi:DNA-binding MarR family transcriptional regulator